MVLTDQCNFLHQNGRGQLRMGVYIYMQTLMNNGGFFE